MELKFLLSSSLFLFLIAESIFPISADTDGNTSSPIITIKQGQLQGSELKSRSGKPYFSFLGIPYAQKPRRFQNPEPPLIPGWDGIRNSTIAGSNCIQGPTFVAKIFGSEDCLYLNVYTPSTTVKDDGKLHPVIVFIHGGAFIVGSGDFQGEKYFMDEPVVLVTFNYRLSVLGFFSLDHANKDDYDAGIGSGNFGMKDQVMALKWVNDNIKAFGGDSSKITIFGTSAGAASVSYHMLSPMSQGLFQNAIAASGSGLCSWGLTRNPRHYAKELGKALDCPIGSDKELVDCLLAKDAEDIIAKESMSSVWPLDPLAAWTPSLEPSSNNSEVFLSEDPEITLREGNYNIRIPLLAGITKNEGVMFHSGRIMNNPVLTKELNDNWNKIAPVTFVYEDVIPKEKWNDVASEIRTFYFGSNSTISKTNETDERLEHLYSDRNFFSPVRSALIYHTKHNGLSFPYFFDYTDGEVGFLEHLIGNGYRDKVAHGSDIKFGFNLPRTNFQPNSPSEDFSKKYVKLLVSFARDGKPDGKLIGDAEWPATSLEEAEQKIPFKWFHLNTKTMLENESESLTKRMNFWDKLLKKYAKN